MQRWRVDWAGLSIFCGDEEVATFDAAINKGVGYIYDFRLSESTPFRKGFGGKALRALEQDMRHSGANKVVLDGVLEEAEPFWERNGYRWPEEPSDEDEEWDYRMCKTFKS